jgi:hypothetical protein
LWRTEWNLEQEKNIHVPLHPDAAGQWSLYSLEGNMVLSGQIDSSPAEVSLSGKVKYLQFHVEKKE